jgi:hypothetical protein
MADYKAGQHLLKSWPDISFVVLFIWSVTHLVPVFASQESSGKGIVSGLNIYKFGISHFSIM